MRLEWKHIECVNFDLDFDFLLGHCTFVKSRFANERTMARKWDAEATAGLTEEQRHKFYERHGDEGYYVNDLFRNIQWSAMFVAAFNLFERTLNDICTISGSVAEASIHPTDITGRGTERAQTYLSKAQYVHKPFRPSEWRQVKEYATVRNVLSHTYGELDLSSEAHRKVFTIATRTKGIRVERHDRYCNTASIVVEETVVFDAIKTYRKVIWCICETLTSKGTGLAGDEGQVL